MEKRNTAWYVQRRGELLAEQFLLNLRPDNLIVSKDGLFDHIAFFSREDGTPIVIGVEIKATEREIGGRFQFPANQASKLLRINIPVLVIVIDVKTNEIYFEWIKNSIPADKQAKLHGVTSCTIHLRKSTEEALSALRNEILSDRLQAVA